MVPIIKISAPGHGLYYKYVSILITDLAAAAHNKCKMATQPKIYSNVKELWFDVFNIHLVILFITLVLCQQNVEHNIMLRSKSQLFIIKNQ